MKYAVITTFPNNAWDVYAKRMVKSFCDYWPKDKPFLIQLDGDEGTEGVLDWLHHVAQKREREIMIQAEQSEEYLTWLESHKDFKKPESEPGHAYKYEYLRFSHKVFAIAEVLKQPQFVDLDYLFWIDADVVTNKFVKEQDIERFFNKDAVVSYLGRKDWSSSETGFLCFNLQNGGREFIHAWKSLYLSNDLLKEEEWTDAYAFDIIRKQFDATNKKQVCFDLAEGIEGRDVFEHTVLGEYMTHHKGPKKKTLISPPKEGRLSGSSLDCSNMGIMTKNCVDNEVIRKNVAENMRVFDEWLEVCKPNDEEIVICSAGPSLKEYIPQIREKYEQGMKIVAVKHALDTLLKANITPWACILLDPRPHVGEFVSYPPEGVRFFVASMVDPNVVRHLRECRVPLYGYHAAVGAGEIDSIPFTHKGGGHILVEGGSATATRGISLLEIMGFKTMHLYGYDCCYFKKPDLHEKKTNGKYRYEEVTLAEDSYGYKAERTWWTEGQFLAQVQEFRNSYVVKEGLTLYTYGDGIIPWMHRHMQLHEDWKAKILEKDRNARLAGTTNINQWLDTHGISKPRRKAGRFRIKNHRQ